MAHGRFIVFKHRNDGPEQFGNTFVFGRNGGNNRNSDHAPQGLVIQFDPLFFRLIEHIERDDDLQVHVDQLGGQKEVAFEVRGV